MVDCVPAKVHTEISPGSCVVPTPAAPREIMPLLHCEG